MTGLIETNPLVEAGQTINVLHLISSFNQGGSEKQAIQLASRLAKRDGFKAILATLRDEGPLRGWSEGLGFADTPVFPVTSFYGSSFPREIGRFRRFVAAEKIDILHCHDFYTNVFGIIASRYSGVTSTIASKRETTGTRTAAQSFVEKQVFRWARTVVANSQAVRRFLVSQGVPESKIEVVYNSVDVNNFDSSSANRDRIIEDLGLPGDSNARFVTLVANLHMEVKNQGMLLRAARQILGDHPDTHFVFAGEGKLKDSLQRQAGDLGISAHTHFLGRCARVPDLLRISFAGVLTSDAEGFSNAILEYMAAGLPVVATDVGGAREAIIDGRSGFIVPRNADDVLAEKLGHLLGNPESARQMGMNGRAIVQETFSPDAQLERTIEVYRRVFGE